MLAVLLRLRPTRDDGVRSCLCHSIALRCVLHMGRRGQGTTDTADRIIAATARHLDAALVTADEKILSWGRQGHVAVIPAR